MCYFRIFHKWILINLISILSLSIMPVFLQAQPVPIPFHKEPYIMDSGIHEGIGTQSTMAIRKLVSLPGVPWLQLHFSDYNLGTRSYIEITSIEDGGQQRLNSKSLEQWRKSTAYFNGDTVAVELHVAPGETGIFFSINEVTVGEWGGVMTETICGSTDDRVSSNDPAVGRIVPGVCTGWIVSNGALLTAGHCNGAMNIIQFNVPDSNPNGSINNPPPEDQYPINQGSIIFSNGGIGNDWAVFRTDTNSNTNQLPVERQGVFYRMTREAPLPYISNVRVTGFGVDTGTDNFTQQTELGMYNGEGQNGNNIWHGYGVDTMGGNSGSPIIWEGSTFTIGIHTNGGCTSTDGENIGTSFEHDPLETALQDFPGANTRYVDKVFQPPGWWPFWYENGTIFQPFNFVTESLDVVPAGGIVSIVAGSYSETMTINKAVTLVAPVGAVTIGQ